MGDFRVYVTDGRLAVRVTCAIEAGNVDLVATRIQKELSRLGLTGKVSSEGLQAWLQEALSHGGKLSDAVLLEGVAPEPSQDARIEWADDFFAEEFRVDEETGAIDYRNRVTKNTVEPGQLLAHYAPPVRGRKGRDVYGKAIDVPSPQMPRLRAGMNVHYDESASTYTATETGRVRYVDGVLSVDPVYHVDGNVSLETGNIDHPGAVIVEGDVERGAVVQAKGDIEVKGTVEGAQIETEGKLTVRNGITGAHGKQVSARGAIHAKFILESHVECGGDVVIEREILNSTVRCRGKVNMRGGRLLGGHVVALGDIVVGQLGSDTATATDVHAAYDYWLADELERLQAEEKVLEQRFDQIAHVTEALADKREALPEDKRDALDKLLAEGPRLEEKLEELRQIAEEAKRDSQERMGTRIRVSKAIYPEVTVAIGEEQKRIRELVKGPVQVVVLNGRVQVKQTVANDATE